MPHRSHSPRRTTCPDKQRLGAKFRLPFWRRKVYVDFVFFRLCTQVMFQGMIQVHVFLIFCSAPSNLFQVPCEHMLELWWRILNRIDTRASNFLTALATNATAKRVGIVLYSGNVDALVPHFGTEGTVMYMTSEFLHDYASYSCDTEYNIWRDSRIYTSTFHAVVQRHW